MRSAKAGTAIVLGFGSRMRRMVTGDGRHVPASRDAWSSDTCVSRSRRYCATDDRKRWPRAARPAASHNAENESTASSDRSLTPRLTSTTRRPCDRSRRVSSLRTRVAPARVAYGRVARGQGSAAVRCAGSRTEAMPVVLHCLAVRMRPAGEHRAYRSRSRELVPP